MNNRLYRSTSEAVFGGVAAGIARYFGIDPILVRIAFVLGTLMTGFLFFVYLLLWAVLPSPASTATQVGDIVRENVNELTGRLRPEQAGGATGGAANGGAQARQGLSSSSFAWILILLGGFFLLNAVHITRWHSWPLFWPAVLVIGGIWLLRRNRA